MVANRAEVQVVGLIVLYYVRIKSHLRVKEEHGDDVEILVHPVSHLLGMAKYVFRQNGLG